METKHTKGEWKAFRSKNNQRTTIYTTIRGVYDFEILHNESSFSESEANAKLIAAAPETLQALIEIKEYIDKMGKVSIAMQMIKNKAKEAIKIATE